MTTQDTQTGSLLTISITRIEEGGVLVSLGGRLTIDSSPELRNQLLAVLYGETLKSLVIDLSDVPYVDLSCLGSAGNGEAAFPVSVDSAPSGRGFSRHWGYIVR